MTNTIARIKKAGKNFEVIVDMDNALKFKKGEINYIGPEIELIFTDSNKGLKAPSKDIEAAFGTTDVSEITKKIIKEGEILITQEHRDEEKEKKLKQIIDFLSRNSIDPQTGNPHTPERIKNAIEQANIHIKNKPIDTQITDIIHEINKIIPIKISTKKIKILVPAIYTGKVYGILTQYKERENWKDNGDLEVIINIPAGMIMDFYDKLNSFTHGSAITEELKTPENSN